MPPRGGPEEHPPIGFHLPPKVVELPPIIPEPEPLAPVEDQHTRPNPDPRLPMFLSGVMGDPRLQIVLGPDNIQFVGWNGTMVFQAPGLLVKYLAPFPGEPETILYHATAPEDKETKPGGLVKAVAKGSQHEHHPEED